MAPKKSVPLLITLMLVTGVCNTLLTKYQDNICVRDCSSPTRKTFEQPVLQTLQMFFAEMASWLFVGAHYIYKLCAHLYFNKRKNQYQPVNTHDENAILDDTSSVNSRTPLTQPAKIYNFDSDVRNPLEGWRIFLLSLPAVCDICGTTLMNVGLLFVAPSIYQMTRGALVFFVGLFSVIFLKKKLHLFHWFALATVVLGVSIVGLAGASFNNQQSAPEKLQLIRRVFSVIIRDSTTPQALQTTIGVFLIAGAQIFTATQFVLEEFILQKFALDPLKVVGWEGFFGFFVTSIVMIIMHLLVGRTHAGRYGYFDMVEAWREVTQIRGVRDSSILIMISIGGFNYFGLTVTRNLSATSRSTIDTCRTLFIWIVSLLIGWETFKWLQIVGFGLLVYGTFLFNGLIRPPLSSCIPRNVENFLSENINEQPQSSANERRASS
ncbi:Uncharacterized protein C12G12.12 [Golovinomyces cichoracearum]|uniref:Uncharacterized protein C12G12.12 n=1 Tax=Golovinomyces cichoracearum TaxID=62708 RepID=A0A420J5U8_9PEZI|nr:Uncharacterized protein C12G12.12 [Golovinomyces cichoracearum]